jgi:hypothetical protein
MKQYDVLVKVLLGLAQNPFLEVNEVKSLIRQSISNQPFDVILKVSFDFGWIEDAVDHMATEQSHLYFIFEVTFNGLVLMYKLEYMRCC